MTTSFWDGRVLGGVKLEPFSPYANRNLGSKVDMNCKFFGHFFRNSCKQLHYKKMQRHRCARIVLQSEKSVLLSTIHGHIPVRESLEVLLVGKEAVVPVLVEGTREDLRKGRAKMQGLKVGSSIRDYNPKRDLVPGWTSKENVPFTSK